MRIKEGIKKYCEEHETQLKIVGCVAGVGLISLATFIMIRRIKGGNSSIVDMSGVPIKEELDLINDDDVREQILEDWKAVVEYMYSDKDCGEQIFQYRTPLENGKRKLATLVLETVNK